MAASQQTINASHSSIIETIPEMHNTQNAIPLPEGKKYHLFLSHASEDEAKVIPMLEILESEPYNLKCCIDRRDFMLGETIMNNINYAFNKSMGTVIFLTPKFLASDYCNHEKQTAYSLFMDGEGRIIPVILEPCFVPDEFRTIHYIDEANLDSVAQKIYRCLQTGNNIQSFSIMLSYTWLRLYKICG